MWRIRHSFDCASEGLYMLMTFNAYDVLKAVVNSCQTFVAAELWSFSCGKWVLLFYDM